MAGDFSSDFSGGGATRLALYNEALIKLGQKPLRLMTEMRDDRAAIDVIFDVAVKFCLAAGLWKFAKRVSGFDADATGAPEFAYNFRFAIPSDWVRTIIVSTSPNMDPPLLQYMDDSMYWYANFQPLYVSYVSSDVGYGLNLGAWPEPFFEYVACRLAVRCARRVLGVKDALAALPDLKKDEARAGRVAKADAAMDEPPGLPPVPMWVRARRGAMGPGGVFFGGGGGGLGGAGGSFASGPAGDD